MLNPKTTADLAEALVDFLNAPVRDARGIEALFGLGHPASMRSLPRFPGVDFFDASDATNFYEGVESPPVRRQPPGYYENLRKEARELLAYIHESRDVDVAASLKPRRRRILVRSFAERLAAVQEFLASRLGTPDQAYPYTSINGRFQISADGETRIAEAQFQSVDDAVAVLIAEMQAPDSPIRVVRCSYDSCDRFLVQRLGVRGGKRWYCRSGHPSTPRVRRHRRSKR